MAPPVRDVSVIQFAELLGLSTQRIYQYVQEGLPHRKRKTATRIMPKEAIRWLRERDRAEALAAVVERGLSEATGRARKVAAEADLKELELAQLRRTLVPTAETTAFVEAFVTGFASVAAGQLGRFEREMVRVASPAEARALRTRIHTALMEGAQRYADALDDEATDLEQEPVKAAS